MVKKMMMNLDDDVDEVLRKSVPNRKGALKEQVNRILRAGLGMQPFAKSLTKNEVKLSDAEVFLKTGDCTVVELPRKDEDTQE